MTAPVLRAGRMACLNEQEAMVATQPAATGQPVYLRAIAQDLERTLLTNPESNVHWVSVVDEQDTFGPPTRIWEFDDYLLHVSLAQGFSEGMLIHVFAQKSRYCLTDLVPLLRIKVLCGPARACRELEAIWAYFNDSPQFLSVKRRDQHRQ